MATKNKIFERYLEEYLKATKERKSEILDHVVDVIGTHRKAAIRRFRVLQLRDKTLPEGRGRPVYYTKEVEVALYTVWEAANQQCGELLFPSIPEYVAILERDGMWSHGDEATNKLLAMKKRTVRRRCEKLKKKHGIGKGKSGTKPSLLKSIIPIRKGPWTDKGVGAGQLDTVAHCGGSLLGDFVWTLNYTDIATYWIVPRAQWNKGEQATVLSMKTIKKRLPFPWVYAHPDSGGEFINWHAKDWCDEHNITYERSEPNKKNDNCYVEERNGHVVRKYLGYTRFDCRAVVDDINELYDVLALYLNHFQTVRRTESKERIGAKYKRTFEEIAKTPYQRVLERSDVPDEIKDTLCTEHEQLNPLVLKQKIDTLTMKIMKKQRDFGNL